MATTQRHLDVPAARVWEVLADGRRYADWVVGAKRVRSVEGDWPEPGAKFHHAVGIGPLQIKDSTSVVEVEPPRRIVLEVRVRPLMVARVELEIESDGPGCTVTMVEVPVGPLPARLARPLLDPAVIARNRRALARLAEAAGQRAGS